MSIRIAYNNLSYLINNNDKTAFVVGSDSSKTEFYIPRSIIFENQEYIVTRICKDAFKGLYNLKSIQFAENSEVQIIETKSFNGSFIESISIPSSVVKLEERCFFITPKLESIFVSKNNQQYSNYEDKFLLGKSTPEKENFDVLVCAFGCTETVKIPNFIEIIGPNSFGFCTKQKRVEFLPDSKLRKIEKYAFYLSSIESIILPPSLMEIDCFAFYSCNELKKIEIPQNSHLVSIGKDAFSGTYIESLFIPSSTIDLQERWCYNTPNLMKISIDPNNLRYSLVDEKYILGKSNPKNENYDVLVFSVRSIESIIIPSFVEVIGASAFQSCCKLREIEFEDNSKLRKIEQFSISHNQITKICIPPGVTYIGESAFIFCRCLQDVVFSTDSELQKIESNTFDCTPIEYLTIPSNVIEIKGDFFNFQSELKKIKVSPNNRYYSSIDDKFIIGKSNKENENFNVLVFAVKTIKKAIIPSFIEFIGQLAFKRCEILKRVEFVNDSKLYAIKEEAFDFSTIECFTAPSSLNLIETKAFFACKNLTSFAIPNNSNLRIIENKAFAFTNIRCFSVPSGVTFIGPNAFSNCENLQIIEFDENLKMQNFDAEMFSQNMNALVMIPFKISIKFNLNK